MIVFLLVVVGLSAAIYFYLTRYLTHWKNRGVNGPKPKLIYGNFESSIRQKRSVVYDYSDIYKQFKGKERFIGVFFSISPQLMILDAGLVKEIMVKNFKNFHDNEFGNWFDLDPIFERNPFFLTGEKWKNKRAEITPVLSTAKLKCFYTAMQAVSKKITQYILAENVKETRKDGYDALELFRQFTTENMTDCLYGIEAGAFTENCPIRQQIEAMNNNFMKLVSHYFLSKAFPILKYFLNSPLMPKSVQDFFVDLMKEAMNMRKTTGQTRFDILTLLMETQEKKTLSDLDVVGHAMTFFLDGTETSSSVLTHIFNMIARHENVQKRLRNELNEAVEQHGDLSFDVLTELPYLDQVIHETLRLYPSIPFTTRLCTEPCEIENVKEKKIPLRENDVLMIPIYCLHRDEEYFEDPEKFDPDRFSPENGGFKKYKDMGVFIPFGDGPRQCIGMKLALLQIKACISEIIRNWEIRLNPKTIEDIVIDPKSLMIMPEGGVWLDFKKIE